MADGLEVGDRWVADGDVLGADKRAAGKPQSHGAAHVAGAYDCYLHICRPTSYPPPARKTTLCGHGVRFLV